MRLRPGAFPTAALQPIARFRSPVVGYRRPRRTAGARRITDALPGSALELRREPLAAKRDRTDATRPAGRPFLDDLSQSFFGQTAKRHVLIAGQLFRLHQNAVRYFYSRFHDSIGTRLTI